jgi:hypothetical protein
MSYQMSAVVIRKISGKKVSVRLPGHSADSTIEFAPLTRQAPWPKPGLEAYIVPGQCTTPADGRFPVMVKVFKRDLPHRAERTQFLTETLQLGTPAGRRSLGIEAADDWMYHGIPMAWLGSVEVPVDRGERVRVIGHMTRHIGGDQPGKTLDVEGLKIREPGQQPSFDSYSEDERRELALHLIRAVERMERLQLAHGDLSQGNVLIGPGPTKKPAATLCDFDGFYHPKAPLLPRRLGAEMVRPIGTPGYQHPEVAEEDRRSAGIGENVLVATDRFALAVLVCEVMVWDSALRRSIGRDTLLSDVEFSTRSLAALDKTAPIVRRKFPEGIALLEKALSARGMWSAGAPADWARQALPSPADWERVVRGGKTWDRRPTMRLIKQIGNQSPALDIQVNLGSSSSARFDRIQGAEAPLDKVEYHWDGTKGQFEIWLHSQDDLRLRRAGTTTLSRVPTNVGGPTKVSIYPGDELAVAFVWRFSFT